MFFYILFDKFFLYAEFLLSTMPVMNLSIPVEKIDIVFEFIAMAAYFVPLDTVLVIAAIVIMEEQYKIAMALVKFVKSWIPLMGG